MRALSKKSVWPKLPDLSVTEIGLLPLEWGDHKAGTPWEISSPILSSSTPKPFMTAPEVSPPAEINVPKLSFTSFLDSNSKKFSILFAKISWPYCFCFYVTVLVSEDE